MYPQIYKLVGTYRLQTAIGVMEDFSALIEADSTINAMDNQRSKFYHAGYNHILFKEMYKYVNGEWVEIPMMVALGLE
jgi:hypothetical protein